MDDEHRAHVAVEGGQEPEERRRALAEGEAAYVDEGEAEEEILQVDVRARGGSVRHDWEHVVVMEWETQQDMPV